MYILVLSKIEVVQEQKKVDRNIRWPKRLLRFFYTNLCKKKKKELLANTIQRNKMEDFIKRICRFPRSYNFSFNNLVEEKRKGILNKIRPQEKKELGKDTLCKGKKQRAL